MSTRAERKRRHEARRTEAIPTIPRELLGTNFLGQMALALAGDEDPSDLFNLLTAIFERAVGDRIRAEGCENLSSVLDDEGLEFIFVKPYGERTAKIVTGLFNAGYLRLAEETSNGKIFYANKPPAGKDRTEWMDKILTVAERSLVVSVSKSKNPFTQDEQARVMGACGIPLGATFDFTFLDGTRFDLAYTKVGIEAHVDGKHDTEKNRRILPLMLSVWQLQAFAHKHGLGDFSTPMPDSELERVSETYKRLSAPEYSAMPVEDLIPKIEQEFRAFWEGHSEL